MHRLSTRHIALVTMLAFVMTASLVGAAQAGQNSPIQNYCTPGPTPCIEGRGFTTARGYNQAFGVVGQVFNGPVRGGATAGYFSAHPQGNQGTGDINTDMAVVMTGVGCVDGCQGAKVRDLFYEAACPPGSGDAKGYCSAANFSTDASSDFSLYLGGNHDCLIARQIPGGPGWCAVNTDNQGNVYINAAPGARVIVNNQKVGG